MALKRDAPFRLRFEGLFIFPLGWLRLALALGAPLSSTLVESWFTSSLALSVTCLGLVGVGCFCRDAGGVVLGEV